MDGLSGQSNSHPFWGRYDYSLNGGNIRGSITLIDGRRVFKHEERVKLFGHSHEFTLFDRDGKKSSMSVEYRHRFDSLG